MGEFDQTTELKVCVALSMGTLVILVLLLGLCHFIGRSSKESKSMELNEEQFFDNIERAKKGDSDDVKLPNYHMSNS
jgi:hypothetical protein